MKQAQQRDFEETLEAAEIVERALALGRAVAAHIEPPAHSRSTAFSTHATVEPPYTPYNTAPLHPCLAR
jgi:hypothetical protein